MLDSWQQTAWLLNLWTPSSCCCSAGWSIKCSAGNVLLLLNLWLQSALQLQIYLLACFWFLLPVWLGNGYSCSWIWTYCNMKLLISFQRASHLLSGTTLGERKKATVNDGIGHTGHSVPVPRHALYLFFRWGHLLPHNYLECGMPLSEN